MSTKDFEAETVDYQKGSIYECPELRRSINESMDGKYTSADGKVYFEFRSVRDIEEGL